MAYKDKDKHIKKAATALEFYGEWDYESMKDAMYFLQDNGVEADKTTTYTMIHEYLVEFALKTLRCPISESK